MVMGGVALGWAGLNAIFVFPTVCAVETLQREHDLTSLTPKDRLIAAQPVDRWQQLIHDGHAFLDQWATRRRVLR
jgi:hypothetical protein